eukprot:236684-Chlamydomonas_euryale.AAC.1
MVAGQAPSAVLIAVHSNHGGAPFLGPGGKAHISASSGQGGVARTSVHYAAWGEGRAHQRSTWPVGEGRAQQHI